MVAVLSNFDVILLLLASVVYAVFFLELLNSCHSSVCMYKVSVSFYI